ncbi:hypothetical protein SCHPADRAFT_897440, partial [Schizopora paradoxa]
MKSKEEIDFEKLVLTLSRNKLVSHNMVRKVSKAKLEALCKSMQIEVLGHLKPDYIEALQRWAQASKRSPATIESQTSYNDLEEFHRLSNVVEAMDDLALHQRASGDLVRERNKTEVGDSGSRLNQIYTSGLQLVPLGNAALSNVARGHQLAGSAIPITSFVASYASLAQSEHNPMDHHTNSYLPSYSSSGLTSSPADREYQSSDRPPILEVSYIDSEATSNVKNSLTSDSNKRRRLDTLPEVDKPGATASNQCGGSAKTKEKNLDKELYNSPTNWRHLRQEVCPLEPNGDLNLDALNIMFGFAEGISSRVIHPKTRRPVFMADGK